MEHYTTGQFQVNKDYKTDFCREYCVKVYDFALSRAKEKEAARAITKSVFAKALETLPAEECNKGDHWPLLEGYVLAEASARLNGRAASVEPAPAISGQAKEEAPSAPKRKGRSRVMGSMMLGVNLLLSLLLAWLLIGLLIRLGALPAMDLGYSWFNLNVLQLF